MNGTPKKNGKGNGKAGAGNGKRNGKGQFVKGNANAWKPGQSGNPKGYRSMGSLLTAALREQMTNKDGTVTMETMEFLSRKLVKWAHEENPSKDYTARQNLAIKSILERFDPVALKIEHQHSGQVAVGLTPAATAFQEACGAFAHEHDRRPTIRELREIRNGLRVTDADLGINGHGS